MTKRVVKRVVDVLFERTVIVFFVVYILLALLLIPGFSKIANISAVLIQASFLSIISCGLTFVFMNGGIDFSIIGVMSLCSVIGATIMKSGASSFFIVAAIIAMMGIGLVVGCFNGFSVTVLKMPSFIATMATQLILSGIAIWYTQSSTIGGLPKGFVGIGQGDVLGIPAPVIVAFVMAAIAGYVLHGTVFGRYVMAVGTNQRTSKISGIPVEKTIFSVFLISSLFASVASVMMTAKVASGIPSLGDGMIMDIVAAVVLGGTSVAGGKGTILGTVLGSLLVIMLNNSLNLLGIEWFVINICKGLMVLLVAVMDLMQLKRIH